MPPVLLIGNDINNITSTYTWSDLLHDLIGYARLKESMLTEGKPFPLLYEEIFLNAARQYGTKEKRIKTYIAVKTLKLQPNRIHTKIIRMKFPVLLTTNYDLTLEYVLTDAVNKITNGGVIKENLYSLFRRFDFGDSTVWHIHGSALHPTTITLGYEHYSGYLQQMRNYVVTGVQGRSFENKRSLLERLKNNEVTHTSWIDYFFTHDVHILGLNLDFVEMHLWWLLTFRARARLLHTINTKNTITYYYPKKYEQRSIHKLQLLAAHDVHIVPLDDKGTTRMRYYDRVLDRIAIDWR